MKSGHKQNRKISGQTGLLKRETGLFISWKESGNGDIIKRNFRKTGSWPQSGGGREMFLLLLLFWIVLNGRITPEIVVFGILTAGAAYLFLRKVLGYSLKTDGRILRNLPLLVLYVLNLILEIIKAAFAVTGVVFGRNRKPDPVIVEFHSGLDGDFRNVLLANSITLTPGTYTVFQEKDHFVIHCLRKEYAKGLDDSSFVHLLRRIR